jgi:hypothetical protein
MKIRTFLFVLGFFLSVTLQAQVFFDPKQHNCITAEIQYLVDNDTTTGLLFMIRYEDHEYGANQKCDLFLLSATGQNQKISSDSFEFFGVYDFKVSEDNQYIAFFQVGEGHPWIEIYLLEPLINRNVLTSVGTINPYPGFVSLDGWEADNKIEISCDVDFNLRNTDSEADLYPSMEEGKERKFLFDLKAAKFTEVK